nr:MAG TPA: hypothetical protein [Bacteriophage sp.]
MTYNLTFFLEEFLIPNELHTLIFNTIIVPQNLSNFQ